MYSDGSDSSSHSDCLDNMLRIILSTLHVLLNSHNTLSR